MATDKTSSSEMTRSTGSERSGMVSDSGASRGTATRSAMKRASATSQSANTSADNILPEGDEQHTVPDAIYGQPAGPVLSRAQRVERDEVLRRRTTPEQYDAIMQQRADADAAAQQSSSK